VVGHSLASGAVAVCVDPQQLPSLNAAAADNALKMMPLVLINAGDCFYGKEKKSYYGKNLSFALPYRIVDPCVELDAPSTDEFSGGSVGGRSLETPDPWTMLLISIGLNT
jgi:hypothetical protein